MTKRGRFDYAKEITQLEKVEVLAEQPIQALKPSGTAKDALQNPAAYALPPQRRGRNQSGLKRTDVPREQMNIRIRPELKRAAASTAALEGMTLGDVIEAALIEYLEKRK